MRRFACLLFRFVQRDRFYDLAAQPETVAALRKEIRGVLDAHGGVMTTKALFEMKLTDSVMRESQRLNLPFSGG